MKTLSCLGVIVYAISMTLFNGFVLVQLWDWFVVSSFNVPQITIQAALGIGLIVSMYTHEVPYPDEEKHTTTDQVIRMAASFTFTFMCLVIGYIIHIL